MFYIQKRGACRCKKIKIDHFPSQEGEGRKWGDSSRQNNYRIRHTGKLTYPQISLIRKTAVKSLDDEKNHTIIVSRYDPWHFNDR